MTVAELWEGLLCVALAASVVALWTLWIAPVKRSRVETRPYSGDFYDQRKSSNCTAPPGATCEMVERR